MKAHDEAVSGMDVSEMKAAIKTLYPTAQWREVRISATTSAVRIWRKGGKYGVWLSTFCETVDAAWKNAFDRLTGSLPAQPAPEPLSAGVSDEGMYPLECTECDRAIGPLHRLDADHAGWICPDCYESMQSSGVSDGEMGELFIGAVEQITGKRPENITHFGPSAASSDPALKAQEGNNNALTESGWKRIAGGAIDVAGMSPEDDVNADMVAYLKRHFIAPIEPAADLASLAMNLAEQLEQKAEEEECSEEEPNTCARCHCTYSLTEFDCEPTKYCDKCAHDVVDDLASLAKKLASALAKIEDETIDHRAVMIARAVLAEAKKAGCA